MVRALESLVKPGSASISPLADSLVGSKILIVDDSELVSEQLQESLEAHQLTVGVALTYVDAITKATAMPNVDTSALISELHIKSKKSVILLVSGLSKDELSEKIEE